MVESVSKTILGKKDALNKIDEVLESLKKFKDQVDEILSFFDEYSEFSEEDLSLIKDKASPSFVSKIHQMEEFKEQRKSIAPKEIYHLHKKLLELLEKYFMDIDKLIKENNLEKLEEKNIKELKKFLISGISIESLGKMRNDVNELEPKIDLDLYKNRLKIQNQELEKKEERIKKFKIVFEQLSEETSKDTIKELINSVMNGEPLDMIEQKIINAGLFIEEVSYEEKIEKIEKKEPKPKPEVETKKLQPKLQIKPKPQIQPKTKVQPISKIQKKEPEKFGFRMKVILLSAIKYLSNWKSFEESEKIVRENMENKKKK